MVFVIFASKVLLSYFLETNWFFFIFSKYIHSEIPAKRFLVHFMCFATYPMSENKEQRVRQKTHIDEYND